MSWIGELGRRIAMRWRRRELERDLDEEMGLHVALRTEELERAGAAPDDARRAAGRRFGNATLHKEDSRDQWGWRWLDALVQDVRYGLRGLARSPGFTTVAVLALALGIGANTAILGVVDTVLLRPLAYRDADRLVVVLPDGQNPTTPKNLADWRDASRSFSAIGAAEYWMPNLSGIDQPEQIYALHVSAEILPLLGIEPALGRVFTADEDRPGNEHEIVIGHGLWQRRFDGDPAIIGRTVRLDGESYTVVGVMPASFKFAPFWATRAELWAPLALAGRDGDRQSLRVFARLAPGVTLGQARAEMAGITARLDALDPGSNRNIQVVPLKDKVVGNVRPALLVVLGAVAFVLLIACANVAHLLLARASARQREIALRRALGAGRGRLVAQFLTESLILATLGGAGGLLLARLGIDLLVALGPTDLPRVDGIALHGGVLAVMMGVSLVAGLAFGLAPALQASSPDLVSSLKGRGGEAGARDGRARSLLVVSQFALALVLLVGAGLMVRSFSALRAIDPGFQPRGVLTMVASLTGTDEVGPRRDIFYRALLARLRALPGVEAVGGINHLPLAGDTWGFPLWIEGRPIASPSDAKNAIFRTVLPGYFDAMRLPLVAGRDVEPGDTLDTARVVIVNQTLAQRIWPGDDALGKRIAVDDPKKPDSWATVIGVARDARQESWAEEPRFEVYFPVLQRRDYLDVPESHLAYLSFVVRTGGDPAGLAPAVRAAVRGLDANVAVSRVETMSDIVDRANGQARFFLVVLGGFAAVALLLAAVGIYGVMSYAVVRRSHEIGVRIALGARRRDVLGLVVGHALVLAGAGGLVGLAGALALTRLMRSMLYGVGATDVMTFVAVAAVLGAVAVLASTLPARRALRIDPMAVLRKD